MPRCVVVREENVVDTHDVSVIVFAYSWKVGQQAHGMHEWNA